MMSYQNPLYGRRVYSKRVLKKVVALEEVPDKIYPHMIRKQQRLECGHKLWAEKYLPWGEKVLIRSKKRVCPWCSYDAMHDRIRRRLKK